MENTPPLAGEPTDLWDWENLFNFPLNPDEFNTDMADDQLLQPWPSSGSGDPPEPSESVAEPAPIEDSVEGSNRVRKRDPRLICPNFIAGIVPCACPELDELAAAEEAEAELIAGPKKRVRKTGQIEIRCQVPGCEADIKELKGYHRRHKVCLACATATYVVLEGQQKRYCQQCGKFHLLPDFDEGKRSCRRKLERHNKRRRRKPNSKNETEIDDQVDLLSNLTGDPIKTSDEINQIETSNLEKENSNGEDISPIYTLLPIMQNEPSNSILSVDQEAKLDNNNNNNNNINDINNDSNNDNNEKPSHSSLVNENKSAYSSSCPTGRISFKLYDWNPAEFPRRLRHQIFEWLSSMPVELEGYIRPGCTILTLFIAMPQFMWDKLSRDAESIVKNLVNAPGSLLLNKGSFLIYLDNMIIQIMKDGTSLMNIKMEVHAPKIHYVYPSFFEVGKNIEFIICGSFLHQPKFRSLVSFNGKYVKHKCNIVEYNKSTGDYNNKDDYFNNYNDHEILRISISDTEPGVFGPAFIEVDNVSGISNFVPVLFGTKNLCTELKKIQEEAFNPNIFRDNNNTNLSSELLVSKQNLLSQLILDIAWLQKKTNHENNNNNNNNNKLSPANIERLTCLLRFLISRKLINILEIILCSLDNILFGEILSNLENGKHDADVAQFLELINHARDCLNNRNKFDIRPPLLTQGNEENPCSTGEPESETVSLVPRQRVLNRENCRPQLGRSWALSYPSGPTRARFAAVVMVGVLVCVTACTVLFHPHEPGSFTISVRRLLNFNG